jgi:hypothetical protein
MLPQPPLMPSVRPRERQDVSVDDSKIWNHARSILLPYEGGASQLYVLDVPVSQCGAVIDLFANFVNEPTVVAIDNYWDDPRPLTQELRSVLLAHTDKSTTHQLKGIHGVSEDVSLNLWLDSKSQTLDAEMVFWSDQLFPKPDDESACLYTFGPYIALAEAIRSVSPSSQCVISASETGDPREHRGKPWTYFW